MITENGRFEYRHGFRYTASALVNAPGQRLRRQTTVVPEGATGLKKSGLQQRDRSKGGRDLAAIQIQRLVRGWRARVWAVHVVHERAWRALILIQVRNRRPYHHQTKI